MRAGLSLALLLAACSAARPPVAETPPVPRQPTAAAGWRLEKVHEGLAAPTALAFDYQNRAYVLEGARLRRLDDGVVVAQGRGKWTGLAFRDGWFYVTENTLQGASVLRVSSGGVTAKLVGDHRRASAPAMGPDGWLYFAEPALTNAAVAEDGSDPRLRDLPCKTVTLTGEGAAFLPFGRRAAPGQQVDGSFPCSGSIVKVHPETKREELVAWGFRAPSGLAFSPDGRLFAVESSYEEPRAWAAGDLLWAVRQGAWHGWPDYDAGRRLEKRLLADVGEEPPLPAAVLGVRASPSALDFGEDGRAYLALPGERRVAVVDTRTGIIDDLLTGIGEPTAVRFDRDGRELWVIAGDDVWKVSRDPAARLAKAEWTPASLRGRVVFFENCNKCHPNGRAGFGPAIRGKLPRHAFGLERVSASQLEDLTAFIKDLKGQEEQ